ncbi:MAG: hypothetical protein QM747_21945 [Nocardioides sp.]
MSKRLPALLAAVAATPVAALVAVLALTGCSANAGADLAGSRSPMSSSPQALSTAGDPGNRSPMLMAGAGEATEGQVDVTALSQADFEDQRHDGSQCLTETDDQQGQVTYCQKLAVVGGVVRWTAYVAVPQDSVKATMSVGNDFEYTASVDAPGSYVKIVWTKPTIPTEVRLSTVVEIELNDGTTFNANDYDADYENGWYSSEDLVLE